MSRHAYSGHRRLQPTTGTLPAVHLLYSARNHLVWLTSLWTQITIAGEALRICGKQGLAGQTITPGLGELLCVAPHKGKGKSNCVLIAGTPTSFPEIPLALLLTAVCGWTGTTPRIVVFDIVQGRYAVECHHEHVLIRASRLIYRCSLSKHARKPTHSSITHPPTRKERPCRSIFQAKRDQPS